VIRIQDDGAGFDPSLVNVDAAGLGRSLIEAFVRQLHGELRTTTDEGTIVEVRFPAATHATHEIKKTA
jgi:two-component sensor histidine kinase